MPPCVSSVCCCNTLGVYGSEDVAMALTACLSADLLGSQSVCVCLRVGRVMNEKSVLCIFPLINPVMNISCIVHEATIKTGNKERGGEEKMRYAAQCGAAVLD